MKPDNAVVTEGTVQCRLNGKGQAAKEAKATVRVLAERGRAYAIYVRGVDDAELTLDLPEGKYRAEWLDTWDGSVRKVEKLETDGGPRIVTSPGYRGDAALRIRRVSGF